MSVRKKVKRNANLTVCIVLLSILLLLIVILIANNFRIEWNVKSGDTIHWELGEDTQPEEIEAVFKGNIFCRKGVKIPATSNVTVNTDKSGEQEVTFSAKNFIFQSSVTVSCEVSDKKGPVISLVSNPDHITYKNTRYVEEGFHAEDAVDGDVTDSVVREEKDGNIYYTATDSSGNSTTIIRNVVYTDLPNYDENKVVYLTFDDGPDKYTTRLLEILDNYNVKTTFFVTTQSMPNVHLIEDIYKKGHTVAVHTYSHDYKKIYATPEAFMEDFKKMNDIVKQYTGQSAWLMRFPGGSSTTYIKNLEQFTKPLAELGVQYCDWNVSSEDAVGKDITKEQIAQNVINGIKKHKVSIVLQHDIKDISVEAVDDIIKWGLENGYTFLPLTPESKMIHHGED